MNDRKRANRIEFHLDDYEKQRLDELAARFGLDRSNFLRQVIRNGKVPELPKVRVRA